MYPIIYKVLPSADWAAAGRDGAFLGSRDDLRDGFVHLSAPHQLVGTLTKYFRDQDDLLLVAFRSADLGHALKFEPSRAGELFPHLYSPLPTALALWQRPLQPGPDGLPVGNREGLGC